MDDASLTELLRTGHIDMEERARRGIWPHPPLKLKDLAAHLARLLRSGTWFPELPFPGREGGIIETVNPFRYVYRTSRTDPLDPRRVVETAERRFWTARGAARHYLRWDLNLPGDLDGWKVI